MDFTFFNQLMMILGLSVCAISLFHRFNLPESLGYLSVGIVLGPTATGLIHEDFDISLLAEIGVVFLLFTLGLEFSISRMKSMKQEVFGLGGLQVLLCASGIFGILTLLGVPVRESLIIAAALALSSTAIVSKELTQSNEIRARQGQLSIGVLLFQDIAAVLFLIMVPAIAGTGGKAILPAISIALAKGALFVAMMLAAGKWLLPVIFNEIARARSDELFVLVALMIALMAAWLTHMLGLSMALGGFIAGMMLGDSNYKHQVEADIRPFRDILLGLFFVSVGLMLDLNILREHWPVILAATATLLVFKLSVIAVLARTFGEDRRTALKTGLILCQGGEFCFALIALATQYGQTGGEKASLVLSATILSMLVAPLLIRSSSKIVGLCFREADTTVDSEHSVDIKERTAHISGHTLICGYGRVGQTISRFLARENLLYVALDDDALHVHEAGLAGEPVFYGDCRRLELLEAGGLDRARQVIICIDNTENALSVVKTIRSEYRNLPILVRTRDLTQCDELKQAGVTAVVPEVLESSLLIVKQVLLMLGMDRDVVRHKIHQAREQQYDILSGYYPGITDIQGETEDVPVRHAVTLCKGSPCEGLRPAELPVEGDVSVMGIKRGGITYEPGQVTRMSADDIVILTGPMASLKQSEKNLI
ncbi:monovalent cation:proton antiporter family protein [Endozoicomonas euniceicola]|uniref:Cation:proton antiporter n=1 Tax=Endozoicomonas euniceicola TaxID=1234143 RepID=A0ABY6GSU9_9GAMM|nr:monovalent cation:proton antiporter family protein [Endozoicomonas euniceicola]UYM15837.1 cation:proton antiporter [Endozoicomonas euniceicola]